MESGGGTLAMLRETNGSGSRTGPVAIVDIGSNSVRLVIYESLSRMPAAVHNEKAICAIGRNMVATGRLNAEGMSAALAALARYRLLADAHGTEIRQAVATAAARDAPNGEDFVRRAEEAWGGRVRVLSGEEEARVAAEGVIAGIPDADGIAADLGGGSLDMVRVKNGETGAAATFPFGPLRLIDLAKGDSAKARDIVDRGLAKADFLSKKGNRTLYAVGGAWRSFARVDMEERKYPLHVLHHYAIPRGRVLKLARVISNLSKKSLDRIEVVSRRRAEALPLGAIVLERLLLTLDIERVIISAYGLREGILHAQLSAEERAKDPLIEFAIGANRRLSRTPDHANELFEWMSPLFPQETQGQRRIRQAVCLFSDIGWRRHPDDRASGTFNQVVHGPFAAVSHRQRALIATAIFHRYSGDEDFTRSTGIGALLDSEDTGLALRIGLAARLGFALSGSAIGQLPNYRVRLGENRVALSVPPSLRAVAGEPVQKRLAALAQSSGRKPELSVL